MTKHKWHKEIKAWADGAKIEMRISDSNHAYIWNKCETPMWDTSEKWEYRIKPQPKEPHPFLGMKEIPYKNWVLRFYKMPDDLWYTEGINEEWMNEMVEASKPQPKEPQYLYVFGDHKGEQVLRTLKVKNSNETYIGKIKLEVDDD